MLKKIKEIQNRPVLKRLIKNTSLLSIGMVASKIINFLTIVPIAQALGPATYGSYSTIITKSNSRNSHNLNKHHKQDTQKKHS